MGLGDTSDRDAAAEAYVSNMVTMNNRPPHRPDVLRELFERGWDACAAQMGELCEQAQCGARIVELQAQLSAARTRSDAFRRALEYYADETYYHGPNMKAEPGKRETQGGYVLSVERDHGNIAREALAAHAEGDETPNPKRGSE